MENLEKAIFLFNDSDREPSLVLVKDEEVITSFANGIKPLLTFLNEGYDLNNYALADKIVGKAQALLCLKAGIKEVYAKVLSQKAQKIFEDNNVKYKYQTLTKEIINRQGNDICPMEKAVKDCDDPDIAFDILNDAIKKLYKLS